MRDVASATHVLLRAAKLAVEHGWCVIVCPSASPLPRILRASLPFVLPGIEVCGRTSLLVSGARLSVVHVDEPVFVPTGTPYGVLLVGWGDDLISAPMHLTGWREGAAHVEAA